MRIVVNAHQVFGVQELGVVLVLIWKGGAEEHLVQMALVRCGINFLLAFYPKRHERPKND